MIWCKLFGHKFVHEQHYYGVATGRTTYTYFNHCLRCGVKAG